MHPRDGNFAGGEGLEPFLVLPTVAGAVDSVVHLYTPPEGRRRAQDTVGLTGRFEDDIIEISDRFSFQGDRRHRGDERPPPLGRFLRSDHELLRLLSRAEAA